MNYDSNSNLSTGAKAVFGVVIAVFVSVVILGGMAGCPAYDRYQTRMNAENTVQINNTVIQQTAQLVQVEQQKAQIRVVEAEGISQAQKIINATLTDRYLQHEAINAQASMANSPNHTTIYIPSGQNGIPIVRTVNEQDALPAKKD